MPYRGQTFTIPLGQQGLLTDVAPGLVPSNALIKASSVTLNLGSIEKAPGASAYNTQTLTNEIVALVDYWPNSVTQRMFAATSAGNIYRDIGDRLFSSGTAVKTGLGPLTPQTMFVEGGNETAGNPKKLFFFSGTSQVQVLEGDEATFAAISNPASEWTSPSFPTGGIIHRNRLWAFGAINAPARVYASDTGNHEQFTSNILSFEVFPGEGGRIIAAYVYKGRLFFFKEGNFIYYLNDEDPDSDNWYVTKLSSGFGIAGPHAVMQVVDNIFAMNSSGSVTDLQAADTFGDVEAADIFSRLQIEQFVRSNVALSGLENTHALYYPAKKQAYLTGKSMYGATNNLLHVLDVSGQGARFMFWHHISASCLALRRDINNVQRPMFGGTDGYVYLMDREDRDVGGSGYEALFKTPHIDFRELDSGLTFKDKIFDFLAVEFVPQGSWNVTVNVYIDGEFSEAITVPMNVRSDGLDTFELDTDELGREEAQTIMKPLHGIGKRISFEITNSGTRENFRICSLTVGFRVAGENQTRL